MGNAKLLDLGAPVIRGAGTFAGALRGLRDRERVLLRAYIDYALAETEKAGKPTPMCWPTDDEVAAHLGRSASTVRRSRARLAAGPSPFITLAYVPPFGLLPDGTTSAHGRNVVMLLAGGAAEEAAAVRELAAAETDVRQLELALGKAKARVVALQERVQGLRDEGAANDGAPSSHNAPQRTPGCALRKGRVVKRIAHEASKVA